MNPDFPRESSYPCSDLNYFQTYGIELGRGPFSSFQVERTEDMEEHIGGRMKKKPELVSGKAWARSSVRHQMVLVFLDHKFHGSPARKDCFINEPVVPVFQVGDDETGVGPETGIFDFSNNSAPLRPEFGFIESLCEHSNRPFLQIEPL